MAVPISPSSLFHSSSPSFSASSRPLLLPLLSFHYQHNHLRTRISQRTSSSSQERAVLIEEEDRSMDLFVRFVENVYEKVSRRACKAVRSVLPVAIPSKLVNFAVHGALILAFLWVLKAFLQVVCTLGSWKCRLHKHLAYSRCMVWNYEFSREPQLSPESSCP